MTKKKTKSTRVMKLMKWLKRQNQLSTTLSRVKTQTDSGKNQQNQFSRVSLWMDRSRMQLWREFLVKLNFKKLIEIEYTLPWWLSTFFVKNLMNRGMIGT